MSRELASIRLLREALEGVMPPAKAAGVMFEGLGAWGERVPVTAGELKSALHGPIRDALDRRLLPGEVDAVVEAVERVLATAEAPTDVHGVIVDPDAPTAEHPGPGPAGEHEGTTAQRPALHGWPNEQTTLRLPAHSGGPVPVVVLAGSDSFGMLLTLALGPERVRPTRLASLDRLRPELKTAALVLLDATDVPDAGPVEVARALRQLPADCVASVWGVDLPFGARVAKALHDDGQQCVSLSTEEGIDPLVDLVRSRL